MHENNQAMLKPSELHHQKWEKLGSLTSRENKRKATPLLCHTSLAGEFIVCLRGYRLTEGILQHFCASCIDLIFLVNRSDNTSVRWNMVTLRIWQCSTWTNKIIKEINEKVCFSLKVSKPRWNSRALKQGERRNKTFRTNLEWWVGGIELGKRPATWSH